MMLKSRSLKPSKYRAGEWSKRNMKWTRAEDWAAWGKAKAEDAQRSIEDNLERTEQQGSIDDGEEPING
jgi:hypothetical protein